VYWTFSSVSASDVVLLNDLFVAESFRGAGIGRSLIDATVEIARERGARAVRWWTALDNRRAQRAYEAMDAQRSAWFEYEIHVAGVHDDQDAPQSKLEVVQRFLEPLNGVAIERSELWQGEGTAGLL